MVSAIVLAAGESRRLGKLKQLLPLGESTILEQTIDNLLGSRVGEVIVVLGYRADEIRKRLSHQPVKIVFNPVYHEGMSTSIAAGLRAVNDRAQAIMLVLGDQPFIDGSTINKLLDEFGAHNKGIAIPVYRSKPGHPVILSTKYRDELLQIQGDVGAREIIKHHADDVLEIPVECPAVCQDIDTADDYKSLPKI